MEAFGSTQLVEISNQFAFWDDTNNGPTLRYQGSPVTDRSFGTWAPIGAEKTAGGYEVAWKNGTADQFIVWNTDANGNYAGNATAILSGADYALQSLETTFQQDLNGDGTTGLKTTPIETSGATRLDQVANEFFLHDSGGIGPSLKYQGTAFTAGQFGAWTPVGVEKVGSGYQVAWKYGSADQYIVWNLDSNGNYASNATGVVSGAEYAFQSLETTFPAGPQWGRHDGTEDDADRDVGRDAAGPGGQRILPARRRGHWSVAEVPGHRLHRRPVRGLDAGRRREDRRAATSLPGRTAAPTSTSSGTSTATATMPAMPRDRSRGPTMRSSRWRRRSSRT